MSSPVAGLRTSTPVEGGGVSAVAVRPGPMAAPVLFLAVPQTPPRTTVQFNLVQAFDTLVEALADRECIVWRDRRLTYGQVSERSRRPAAYLHGRGLGLNRARADLQAGSGARTTSPWASTTGTSIWRGCWARTGPGSPRSTSTTATSARNCATSSTTPSPAPTISHASLAPTLAEVLPTLDAPPEVLLQVVDESGDPLLPGANEYEEALANSSPEGAPVEPSPDDLYILYTGGTTAMPKGVLWRQHDIFMAAMGGRKVGAWKIVTSYEGMTARLADSHPVRLMILPPLMHGAVQWAFLMIMAQGATLIFPDDTHLVYPDACGAWSSARRPTP